MARSEDRARKTRLRNMMVDLRNINPKEILPHLTCLSEQTVQEIRCNVRNNGQMDAVVEMFENLPKRENWYSILVNALREMGEDELADKLEGPERRSDPSGPSQSVAMPVTSSHSAHVSQGRQLYQSPPAYDPRPPASQEGHPEPEASVTPSPPYRGAEQNNDRPARDVNPGKAASLPMPIQERRQEPSDPQSRPSAGPRTQSSDKSSPRHEDRPTHMDRQTAGAQEPAMRTLPSNSSPTAGAAEVSVRPKDAMVRKDAALRRMEEDIKKQREEKRYEVRSDEENDKLQNVLSHAKHLPNIPKPQNYPDDVNLNNLSPTKSCEGFFWGKKNTNLEAPNVVEEQSEECPSGGRSLSSRNVNPDDVLRDACTVSNIRESEIYAGISEASTANPSGASPQRRGEANAVSSQAVQGGGGGMGGGEKEGDVGRMEANGGISSLPQRDESSAVSAQRGQGERGGGSGGKGGRGGGEVGGGEEEGAVGRIEASEQTQSGIFETFSNIARAIGGSVLDGLKY